ncbi:hypothetical protein GY45DRAFT_207947 [Cubamyces sp. BRFM 1775]|nr:hypothetical protein GY45DRAFT_207947 [Cubamyces sp. BRFM 1775]
MISPLAGSRARACLSSGASNAGAPSTVALSTSQLDTAALVRSIARFLATIQYLDVRHGPFHAPSWCGVAVRMWGIQRFPLGFASTSTLQVLDLAAQCPRLHAPWLWFSVETSAFALIGATAPNATLPPWQAWTRHAPESPFDGVSDLIVRPPVIEPTPDRDWTRLDSETATATATANTALEHHPASRRARCSCAPRAPSLKLRLRARWGLRASQISTTPMARSPPPSIAEDDL